MKKFDVGKYMFDYMIHIVSNPTARSALPYGGFVCALANKFQVPLWSDDVYVKRTGPFRKVIFQILEQEKHVALPQTSTNTVRE